MTSATDDSNVMLRTLFGDNLQQAMTEAQANLAALVRRGPQAFWRQQAELLDSMEAFATGWFDRRHVGVQAALQAAERMCQATTPQLWLSEYQSWAAGACERVMADAVALQGEFGKRAQAVAPSLALGSAGQRVETEDRRRVQVSEAA